MTVSGTHSYSCSIRILVTFEKLAGSHLSLGSYHHCLSAALNVTLLKSLSTFMTPISSSSRSMLILRFLSSLTGGTCLLYVLSLNKYSYTYCSAVTIISFCCRRLLFIILFWFTLYIAASAKNDDKITDAFMRVNLSGIIIYLIKFDRYCSQR